VGAGQRAKLGDRATVHGDREALALLSAPQHRAGLIA
jgi:hypothetical protein